MQIGEIAKQSGFSKDTLRYYEKIGLIQLTKQQRGANNYRIYDGRILQELGLIKKLKNVGFTLNEIKDLKRMDVLDMISCGTVGPLVKEKLTKIEEQLAELKEQKRKLLLLMQSCKGDCSTTLDELSNGKTIT